MLTDGVLHSSEVVAVFRYKQGFERPATLENGRVYWQWISSPDGMRLQKVRFAGYTACPAIVIIRKGTIRERCPRDELYRIVLPA